MLVNLLSTSRLRMEVFRTILTSWLGSGSASWWRWKEAQLYLPEKCLEASLAKSNTEALVSTIRTLVDGKITVSNCFPLPATLDQIKILHILAFKILFRAMRKYKEAPKVNHGFRGDDMIRVIKIDVSELKSKLSCEEFIIPLSLVLAAVHHCDFHFSKFDAFAILIDMANHVNDQIGYF